MDSKINKSEELRRILEENPFMGPGELLDQLYKEKHVHCTPSLASQVISKAREEGLLEQWQLEVKTEEIYNNVSLNKSAEAEKEDDGEGAKDEVIRMSTEVKPEVSMLEAISIIRKLGGIAGAERIIKEIKSL